MDVLTDDINIHVGHRSRMRAKLFAHGQRIFDTYELLEMLLYHTVPYKDTNPIAKRLLLAFGGLDGVLGASREDLLLVNGIGERTADFIIRVGRLGHIIGAEIIDENEKFIADYDSVGEYLVRYFSGMNDAAVVGIFLDSSMRIISVKKLFDLDYDSGGVKPKAFIDEAVRRSASVVISAHNHPHGPFYPTQGDRATNSFISESLNSAGFIHAEHYIIMGDYYAGIGSLKNFNLHLSQMPAVDHFLESIDNVGGAKRVSAVSEESYIEYPKNGYNVYDLSYFADLIEYALPGRGHEAATTLLKKYHTIEQALCAPSRELISLYGEMCAFYLKLLAYVSGRRVTDNFAFGKNHSSVEIADYLKALFLGESVEVTYLITRNKKGAVTGCHLLGEGTVSSSEVLPRKAIETAVSAKAESGSIAHNHPGGHTTPSSDDVNMTKFFAGLFRSCDIRLTDHYIVAGQLCDTVHFEIDGE